MDDRQAIIDFAQTGSSQAFEHLVRRHIDAVYSTCRRQLRDAHLAEDATQAVFLILARKAGTLSADVVLSAWLFRTCRYACINARRALVRRQHHEQKAAAMRRETTESARLQSDWADVETVLDDAISRLPRADQSVLMLRYFEQREVEEIGARLRISPRAVRMRLSRAVARLRALLARKGVVIPAAALVTGLETLLVSTAPAAVFSSTITFATAAGSAATAASPAAVIAKGALTLMSQAQAKSAAVLFASVFVLAGSAGLLVYSVVQQRGDGALPALPDSAASARSNPDWPLTPTMANAAQRVAAAAAPFYDRSTPANTLRSIAEAMRAGDIEAAMSCYLVSDTRQERLARSIAELAAAHTAYKRAVIDRFGNQVVGWPEPETIPERIDGVLALLQETDTQIEGRVALMIAPPGLSVDNPNQPTPVAFTYDDGGWKLSARIEVRVIDIETREPVSDEEWFCEIYDLTIRMWRDAAEEVSAGTYARFSDVERARVERWQQIKRDMGIRTVQHAIHPWHPGEDTNERAAR
jgi:RNA polymerase sigma factor (sigma-70 family)